MPAAESDEDPVARVHALGDRGFERSLEVRRPRLELTQIELEHTAQLGDTRAAIAAEKAGILKPGVPVIMGRLEASAAEVKEWAVKNVQRENSIEKALLLELKEKLSQVASGYMMASTSGAQFNYFKVAGEYLIEIAKGLPEDTRKLDLAVKKYQHMSSQSVNDADKLILGVINSTAKFRFN